MNEYVTTLANEKGIAVVDLYAAFQGSEPQVLPHEGYLRSDKLHFSDEGVQIVADLLQALGYGPYVP